MKKFTMMLMLAVATVFFARADYTVTTQDMYPVAETTPALDKMGAEIDYQFAPAYATTVTAEVLPSGSIGLGNYVSSKTVNYSYSGVDASWVRNFNLSGMQGGTLNSVVSGSSSTMPSKTCRPHITATVDENITNGKRTCTITITMTTTLNTWQGTTSSASTYWFFTITQEAGSANVNVTLDSNGGRTAMPYAEYKYTNGGKIIQWGSVSNRIRHNTGYKQTTQSFPSTTAPTDQQLANYFASFVMPTTTRAGYVFDGWYTVAYPEYPEANNIRIDEDSRPTAKVYGLKANWLLDAVQNLQASLDDIDGIWLNWDYVADPKAQYAVYRSETDKMPATPIAMTYDNSYNDTSAQTGISYYYWIKAFGSETVSIIGDPAMGVRAMKSVIVPTITPEDGATFTSSSRKITIKCDTADAIIFYTTDGTDPTPENGIIYSKAFSIYETTTIKAVACKDDMQTSPMATATITRVVPLSMNEALDTELELVAEGATEWIGVKSADCISGNGYLKSGAITDEESVLLRTYVTGNGTFSFWWRVSCEKDDSGAAGWDAAIFTAPDADRKEIRRDGIMSEWEQIVVTFDTDGIHVLTWTYRKDESDSDGDDCLYLDGFEWTAKPEPVLWTVTFDYNGETFEPSMSTRIIADGSVIGDLPEPTREGYVFSGWWTEMLNGTEVSVSTVVSGDVTYYAHWTVLTPEEPKYTNMSPVPVRHDWLSKWPSIMDAADNDFEMAALRLTGKYDGKGNPLSVWHDYVAGTDPTNINSRFKANVRFSDGIPSVTWEPDLNSNGKKSERFYKIFGKKSLAVEENWKRITQEEARNYQFFKVTVDMEETADTEEELLFGESGDDDIGEEGNDEIIAPTVSCSGNTDGIGVSWRPVVGAISYEIYRNSKNDSSGATKISSIEAAGLNNDLGYFDADTEIGKTYYYWVKSVYAFTKSGFSEVVVDSRFASHPKNVKVSKMRSDGILVSWDSVEGATSYRIYCGSVVVQETAECGWLDTTVAQGESRMYKRVTSVCAAGEYEIGGEVYLTGYRTKTEEIASVTMTGTSELALASKNEITLLCLVIMESGEKISINPDSWDFGELPDGKYHIEKPNEYLYLTIDRDCFAGEESRNITIHATWTSTDRDCDPTVYNFEHTIKIIPNE